MVLLPEQKNVIGSDHIVAIVENAVYLSAGRGGVFDSRGGFLCAKMFCVDTMGNCTEMQ